VPRKRERNAEAHGAGAHHGDFPSATAPAEVCLSPVLKLNLPPEFAWDPACEEAAPLMLS
jgi:hypothetical protein